MSRWFRHYAGMMRDDKLVRVAIRSQQSIERVLWVWGAILESAAEIDDGGRYDFDTAEAAYFLRSTEDDVLAVANELEGAGRISQGCVVKWRDRQFQSDRSAERQRRYRERGKNRDTDGQSEQRHCDSDAGVTSPKRHGDAPETETETETDIPPTPSLGDCDGIVSHWNAMAQRTGLPCVARLTADRAKKIRARIKEASREDVFAAIDAIEKSSFCCGNSESGWKASFDFVLQPKSFTKLLEGAYAGGRPKARPKPRIPL